MRAYHGQPLRDHDQLRRRRQPEVQFRQPIAFVPSSWIGGQAAVGAEHRAEAGVRAHGAYRRRSVTEVASATRRDR